MDDQVASGKRLHHYGKSPFLTGKLPISMAIFNSHFNLPEGTPSPGKFGWKFSEHCGRDPWGTTTGPSLPKILTTNLWP